MTLGRLRKAFADLARNGVCGTCSECTYSDPAKCAFFDRYDHQLTAESLREQALLHGMSAVDILAKLAE